MCLIFISPSEWLKCSFFPPKSVFLVICGQGNTGMNCSWCDGGLEGDTRVCMFVCACGFVHGGGSGHRFVPLNAGDGAPQAPLAPRRSAGDPTPGARVATPRATGSPGRQQVALHCHQHVWHCPVTAGDTCGSALSPKGTHMALNRHCRGHTDVSVCERCCCILQS